MRFAKDDNDANSSGIAPVMPALDADKSLRFEEPERLDGKVHGARGMLSMETRRRRMRPEKKSVGIEEKAVSWSMRVSRNSRSAKEGSGPERGLLLRSTDCRAESLAMEGWRVPES